MTSDSPQPAIYTEWVYNLHKLLWGWITNKSGIDITFLPLETTEYILKLANQGKLSSIYSKWIPGDIHNIIAEALNKAINKLRKFLGSEINKWKWGNVLKYEFNHPLGKFFNWLNYPIYNGLGGLFTVRVAGMDLSKLPHIVKSASSIRYIANLKPGDIWGYIVLPGGNIGRVFNKHYYDQLPLWIDKGYLEIKMYSTLDNFKNYESIVVIYGGGK